MVIFHSYVKLPEGTPIAAWFISWKILLRWMRTGGTPIRKPPFGRMDIHLQDFFDLNRRVPGFWHMKDWCCVRFIWQCIWLIHAACPIVWYMLHTCYIHATYMLHTCYIHATYMLHTCYCTCLRHLNKCPMPKYFGFTKLQNGFASNEPHRMFCRNGFWRF